MYFFIAGLLLILLVTVVNIKPAVLEYTMLVNSQVVYSNTSLVSCCWRKDEETEIDIRRRSAIWYGILV